MMVSKRNLLFQGFIFRFHVLLQGCRFFGVAFAGHLLSKYALISKNESLGWCWWDCTRWLEGSTVLPPTSHAQFSERKDGKKQKCRFGFAFSNLSITETHGVSWSLHILELTYTNVCNKISLGCKYFKRHISNVQGHFFVDYGRSSKAFSFPRLRKRRCCVSVRVWTQRSAMNCWPWAVRVVLLGMFFLKPGKG